MKTDWTGLIEANKSSVAKFATGKMSGRDFYNVFRNTDLGGEARSLLRNRGVTYARRLARKGLKRRGVSA